MATKLATGVLSTFGSLGIGEIFGKDVTIPKDIFLTQFLIKRNLPHNK